MTDYNSPCRVNPAGCFVSLAGVTPVDDTFLACLRCPIDPAREATLSRDPGGLVCSGCGVIFPVKQSLPVLIPEEGVLPPNVRGIDRLPCRRDARPR
jgi:uncharacterized protein YbaR (Trm112 family)